MSDPIVIPVVFDTSSVGGLATSVAAAADRAGGKVRTELGGAFDAVNKAANKAVAGIKAGLQDVRAAEKLVKDEAENMGKGFGGAAFAATAAGAAIVGSVYAVSTAAIEGAAHLREMGATEFVTDDQLERVDALADSIGGVKLGADIAAVSLGAALEPAITKASTALIDLELFTAKVINTFDSGALSINSWGALLTSLVLGPIKLVVDGSLLLHRAMGTNTDAIESAAKSFDDFAVSTAAAAFAVHQDTDAQKESLAVTIDTADVIGKVTAARIAGTQAAKDHAKAEKDAADDLAKAEEKRAAAVAALFKAGDDKAAEERFQAEIAAHQRVIDLKKLLVVEIVKQRDAELKAGKAVDVTTAAIDTCADAQDAAAAAAERWAAKLGDLPDQAAKAGDAYQAVGDGVRALMDVQIERYKKLGEAGKKQAMNMWEASQAVAVAQTIAAGGVAVAQALAQLGPVAGPIAAAGIVATTLAGALSTVMQAAPEFDTGTGSAQPAASGGRTQQDQFLAMLYRGEGVLTRRGVEGVGGPAAVNQANAGVPVQAPQAQHQTTTIVFRGRVMDRMVTETAKAGGAFSAMLDSIASPPGVARVWG